MRRKIKKFLKKARRNVFKPYFKMIFMRLIVFYQRHLSRHTCLYEPTCSEYMKRSINNKGVIRGIL
ncbi:MAG: membrane protein insertion efficiency factor YidD, partial [Clostridia bacterium]|nr:membrane protein insertion efficiency factor YidD [Clostridia bacterium]